MSVYNSFGSPEPLWQHPPEDLQKQLDALQQEYFQAAAQGKPGAAYRQPPPPSQVPERTPAERALADIAVTKSMSAAARRQPQEKALFKGGLDMAFGHLRGDASRMRNTMNELMIAMGAAKRQQDAKDFDNLGVPREIASELKDQQKILVEQRRALGELRYEREQAEGEQEWLHASNRCRWQSPMDDSVEMPVRPAALVEASRKLRADPILPSRQVAAEAPKDGYLVVEIAGVFGLKPKRLEGTQFVVRVANKGRVLIKSLIDGPLNSDGKQATRMVQLTIPALEVGGTSVLEIVLESPNASAKVKIMLDDVSEERLGLNLIQMEPSGKWAGSKIALQACVTFVPPTDEYGRRLVHTSVVQEMTNAPRSDYPGSELPPTQPHNRDRALAWESDGSPTIHDVWEDAELERASFKGQMAAECELDPEGPSPSRGDAQQEQPEAETSWFPSFAAKPAPPPPPSVNNFFAGMSEQQAERSETMHAPVPGGKASAVEVPSNMDDADWSPRHQLDQNLKVSDAPADNLPAFASFSGFGCAKSPTHRQIGTHAPEFGRVVTQPVLSPEDETIKCDAEHSVVSESMRVMASSPVEEKDVPTEVRQGVQKVNEGETNATGVIEARQETHQLDPKHSATEKAEYFPNRSNSDFPDQRPELPQFRPHASVPVRNFQSGSVDFAALNRNVQRPNSTFADRSVSPSPASARQVRFETDSHHMFSRNSVAFGNGAQSTPLLMRAQHLVKARPPFLAFAGDGRRVQIAAQNAGLGSKFQEKLKLRPPSFDGSVEDFFDVLKVASDEGRMGQPEVAQDALEFAARLAQVDAFAGKETTDEELIAYSALLLDAVEKYSGSMVLDVWMVEALLAVFKKAETQRGQLAVPLFITFTKVALRTRGEVGSTDLHNRLLAAIATVATPDVRIDLRGLTDYVCDQFDQRRGQVPPLTAEHALAIFCIVRSRHRIRDQVLHTLHMLRAFKSDMHLVTRALLTLAELYGVLAEVKADSSGNNDEGLDFGVPCRGLDVRLVAMILDLYPRSRKIAGAGLRAYACMCKLSTKHLRHVIKSDIRGLVETQDRFHSSRSVALHVSEVMRGAAETDVEMLNASAVHLIVSVLRSFIRDSVIAANCITALLCSFSQRGHIYSFLDAMPIVELIMMGEVHRSDPEVLPSLCAVFGVLGTAGSDILQELVDAGAVAIPYRAMAASRQDARIAVAAARAVKSLTHGRSVALQQTLQLRGTVLLFTTLMAHGTNASVVREVLAALAAIGQDRECQKQLCDPGLPETWLTLDGILRVAEATVSQDPDVLAQTCLALGTLTYCDVQAIQESMRHRIGIDDHGGRVEVNPESFVWPNLLKLADRHVDFNGNEAYLCKLIFQAHGGNLKHDRILSPTGHVVGTVKVKTGVKSIEELTQEAETSKSKRQTLENDARRNASLSGHVDIFAPLRALGVGSAVPDKAHRLGVESSAPEFVGQDPKADSSSFGGWISATMAATEVSEEEDGGVGEEGVDEDERPESSDYESASVGDGHTSVPDADE